VPVHQQVLGLYLHVPFCAHICHYCNFNRSLLDAGLKARYVAALEMEIAAAGDGAPADTVFFGGGTPSLLEPEEVDRLVRACRRSFSLTPDAEITLEVNPETVSPSRAAGFRQAGVNRISLGVQSFDDGELARLGRQHSSERVLDAVNVLRQAGVDNLSLDLMLWLPQQTEVDWGATVQRAVALAPEHLSLYLLELYPNAPLREEMARHQWSLAPDDDAAEMYLSGLRCLDDAGYRQYEISNVSKAGRRSHHNLKYWQDGAWIGFGTGAHSTVEADRWRNVASTAEYIELVGAGRSPQVERRCRSPRERMEDALFTGLRLVEGIDLDHVGARYGQEAWTLFGNALERHAEAGRLTVVGHRVALTRQGMLVANEVMAEFV
jgi:oxygen-independent coproporphyrinogen III oxidase